MTDVFRATGDGSIVVGSRRLLSLLLIATSSLFASTLSFSLEVGRRVPGIWKLTTSSLPYERDIRSKLLKLLPPDDKSDSGDSGGDEIFLKLNWDGTFKQYNEGYREGRWMSGRWKLMPTDSRSGIGDPVRQFRLVLAMNRQYYGPQFDVVLEGWVEGHDGKGGSEDAKGLRLAGGVQRGKFLHPRRHPSFFGPPVLADPETLGPFVLQQTLTFHFPSGDQVEADAPAESEGPVQVSDFYGRRFIMTVEPLELSKALKQNELRDPLNHPVDIRSMPVQFFTNNTFTALGVNKILRGRFQVLSNSQDIPFDGSSPPPQQLSMAVSLFGAGRSAPGSVFSEGLGLTHDDERTYLGEIQQHWEPQQGRDAKGNSHRQLLVLGTVFYGTDLGEDSRPEPVARFVLLEDGSSLGGLHSSPNDANKAIKDDYTVKRDDEGDVSYSKGGIFQ